MSIPANVIYVDEPVSLLRNKFSSEVGISGNDCTKTMFANLLTFKNEQLIQTLPQFIKPIVLRLGPGGALECNLTGRCPFFKSLHNPFRKKICILIPCFGIFRLQNNRKTIGKQ